MVSGLCAATTAAPWDLVKTRVQNDAAKRYRGAAHCLLSEPTRRPAAWHVCRPLELTRRCGRIGTVREEGAAALYKGWLSLYLRLGPAVVVQVPLIEYARQLVGLSYFGVVE